eukprot:TRINITY_DN3761_c0_g1_i1.p1 TRINITY_DN3761_c0_g1~~TRINITY_DN3761_c0_g1_i1.p1  ORF type:complete len:144 (+),score=17.20 TRINITY_DN3761_c0_g1_i1:338-769(+)
MKYEGEIGYNEFYRFIKHTMIGDIEPIDSNKIFNEGFWLIEYSHTECPECDNFIKSYSRVASYFTQSEEYDVMVGAVDCKYTPDICTQNNVSSYPTLNLYYNHKLIETYSGERRKTPVVNWTQDIVDNFIVNNEETSHIHDEL